MMEGCNNKDSTHSYVFQYILGMIASQFWICPTITLDTGGDDHVVACTIYNVVKVRSNAVKHVRVSN
jgi:hypothetical protein